MALELVRPVFHEIRYYGNYVAYVRLGLVARHRQQVSKVYQPVVGVISRTLVADWWPEYPVVHQVLRTAGRFDARYLPDVVDSMRVGYIERVFNGAVSESEGAKAPQSQSA